jgi:hypothetical protein
MQFKAGDVMVGINVEDGIYTLGFSGASGKTYLRKLISSYEAEGHEDVVEFTYDKKVSSDELINKISKLNTKVILLDRFDLYFDRKVLDVCSKVSRITLIDLKSDRLLITTKAKLAYVVRDNENSIEVRTW